MPLRRSPLVFQVKGQPPCMQAPFGLSSVLPPTPPHLLLNKSPGLSNQETDPVLEDFLSKSPSHRKKPLLVSTPAPSKEQTSHWKSPLCNVQTRSPGGRHSGLQVRSRPPHEKACFPYSWPPWIILCILPREDCPSVKSTCHIP